MTKNLIEGTVLRFLLVGVFNTVVGCGIMFLLYNVGHFSYWFSSAANYIVGGTVSFFLNKYFTFRKKVWSGRQVIRFIVTVAVCYGVAYGLAKPLMLWALKDYPIGLQENAAMLTGMILYTMLNYWGQKFFAFARE